MHKFRESVETATKAKETLGSSWSSGKSRGSEAECSRGGYGMTRFAGQAIDERVYKQIYEAACETGSSSLRNFSLPCWIEFRSRLQHLHGPPSSFSLDFSLFPGTSAKYPGNGGNGSKRLPRMGCLLRVSCRSLAVEEMQRGRRLISWYVVSEGSFESGENTRAISVLRNDVGFIGERVRTPRVQGSGKFWRSKPRIVVIFEIISTIFEIYVFGIMNNIALIGNRRTASETMKWVRQHPTLDEYINDSWLSDQ